MDLNVGAAVLAGALGTVVMTAVMLMGSAMMGVRMDMLQMLGTMVLPTGRAARALGLVIHLMIGAVYFVIYAVLFQALGLQSGIIGWSVLFGGVHGVLLGVALGMMPAVHPRIAATATPPPGQLPAPGFFGVNTGGMAPMAIILVHVVYAAVAGAIYTAYG